MTKVGPTLRIKGELAGDEDVTVEGRVEGMVHLSRGLLVDKSGVVEADVRAAAVTIHGRIQGNIVAEQRVEIHPDGQLEGNIKSPKIQIHEGAHFKGNVDMSSGGSLETETGGATTPTTRPDGGGQAGIERKP